MSYDTFRRGDLLALEGLYAKAGAILPLDAVGFYDANVIGLRHDCDHFLPQAVEMARWEAARGYQSTYFILHTAPYWDDPYLPAALDEIAGLGHEIGFHTNAVTEAIRTGRDAVDITEEALARLRRWGHKVTGVVAHGDPDCYGPGRELRVVNDEMFVECARPEVGAPDRVVKGTNYRLSPVPMSMFGLEYEANRLPKAEYLSDSGGRWNQPFPGVAYDFPYPDGQLHMLVHPDWWGGALL